MERKTSLFTSLLRVNARQFRCNKCGKPFTEVLDFTPSSRNYTKRFAVDILHQVLGNLKNQDDLTESQLKKLEEVKSVSPILAEMHKFKEECRTIFEESKNGSEGTLKLLDWLHSAKDKFSDACQTIVNWFGEITTYFECHVTNGCVEGINNQLKLIKHSAYGFRHFGNFETRALLACCKSVELAY